MSYQDMVLPCRECGAGFVFTAGEQEFYAQKGFTNEPTRCPAARRRRKEAQQRNGWQHGAPATAEACPHAVPLGEATIAPRPAVRPRFDDTLPGDPVEATVVRVDPSGRFVFVRVETQGIDVYVHSSLMRALPHDLRTGDRVRVSVVASDRGPRAQMVELL